MESQNKAFLGMSLRRDLFNQNGVFIAPARTVLLEDHIELIDRHGIHLDSFDVQPAEKKLAVQDHIDSTTACIQDMFKDIRYSKTIPMQAIREEIVPVIQQTAEHTDFYELFATLQTKDDYTYRHNIAVGVLSTLLGRWVGVSESDLPNLTLAATLHDIGKVNIPEDVLLKPGKLTDEEFELMKRHTILGYQMIKKTAGADHLHALVALQHHERQDGSGYPFGLHGEQIVPFSRIVAVADVFHAITSDRPYRKAFPMYETLQQMNQHAFGQLDPHICTMFINKMMQAMLSHEVLLTNGQKGTIVFINPHAPLHPLVNVEDQFIDLNTSPSLQIVQVSPKQ
ncbi:HD-GYP domain-containing protein [Paenibacillus sp. GCM10012307]|uniref:HD-GYP domain-containing protein n=1 Tax=Paenibacillus roseus TaxID=2798579 RepID=A0A934J7F1_9BACL|nr:HD-GYP domain-containing protein [Paenibacillus roseus]MBJ6363018.1 HD-GYP domain-containing protein [Paenibacillus roseus]